jgi:phosphate transport system protein
VNIAERTMFIATHDPVEVNVDFGKMGKLAQAMLKESLDALINMDEVMAKRVVLEDDKMDAMNRDVYGEVQRRIKETPQYCEYLIHLLSVARHLERIADHASNIADDVIYLVTGDIVRHKSEDYVGETEEG